MSPSDSHQALPNPTPIVRELLLIYVAHKFSGDIRNADRAEHWTAWLNLHIERAVFFCPWLPMARHWVDSGETRARGLAIDLACVRRCDGLIAVGIYHGSAGVEIEMNHATQHGKSVMSLEKPHGLRRDIEAAQQWVDSIWSMRT
jgi:hypothetical protein